MTVRFKRLANGENSVVILVCGRIRSEHVSAIKGLVGQKAELQRATESANKEPH